MAVYTFEYKVAFEIGRLKIPRVYAVTDRRNDQMLLGRDVLNHFITTLNGLANIVEISE